MTGAGDTVVAVLTYCRACGVGLEESLRLANHAAGITVAARLKRLRPALDVAILEPSSDHYYQPGWTLVGGGVFTLEETRRNEADRHHPHPPTNR